MKFNRYERDTRSGLNQLINSPFSTHTKRVYYVKDFREKSFDEWYNGLPFRGSIHQFSRVIYSCNTTFRKIFHSRRRFFTKDVRNIDWLKRLFNT